MEPLIDALEVTGRLLFRIGPVMFVSLFGTELLMRLGVMKYLAPLGKPMARFSNLPSCSAVTFLTAIGSMIAAHTMTRQFHVEKKMTDREMVLTGVLNTVPFHFKEVLTFHFPVILPLLGLRLCLIYIAAFWLAGLVKLAFVIACGRTMLTGEREDPDAFTAFECNPQIEDCAPKSFALLVKETFAARKRMFVRMTTLLFGVTLVVQFLVNVGGMSSLNALVGRVTGVFGLPPAVVGPVSVYIFTPSAGIAFMSNLLADNLVSEYHAIMALLAGGLIMIPITRLRRTLPRYTAIFGVRFGPLICLLTAGLSMAAKGLMLIIVPFLF